MDKETFELYRGVVSDIFDCGPSDHIEDTDVERLLNYHADHESDGSPWQGAGGATDESERDVVTNE